MKNYLKTSLQSSRSQLLQVTLHIHHKMLEINDKKNINFSTEVILNYSHKMIIFKMIITLQISRSQLLQVTRHIHCTMLEISPFDLCFYSNRKKKNLVWS